MANHAAIEHEHRHFEAELPDQFGVGVDVDDGHCRNGLGSFELGQFVKHLVTEPTSLAGDDDEPLFHGCGYLRGGGASPMAPAGGWPLEALTCLAKNSTVVGGTSPTAVTWWPSTTVENADEEPTREGPSAGLISGLRGSTNTETESTPSVNTMCATGSREPGIACAERLAMRKPGGKRMASHNAGAELSATWRSARNQRKVEASTCGLNMESEIRSGRSMVENTICSITSPVWLQSCVLSGIAVFSSIHRR